MKAHPSCEFFIFDGNVYYNNRPYRSGSFTGSIVAPEGFLSLYEYNVDRRDHDTGQVTGPLDTDYPITDKSIIYPYMTKQGTTDCWSSISSTEYYNAFQYGDVLTSSYPMTASITRQYMAPAGERIEVFDCGSGGSGTIITCKKVSDSGATPSWGEVIANSVDNPAPPKHRHYFALRNRLNHYKFRSKHYAVTGSVTGSTYEWIKDEQTMALISIPSIFYGARIQPGSLSLKWYFTGSLIAELQDTKRNGELIQINSSSAESVPINHSGSVAGVVLYEEGFIMLTGSWALNNKQIALVGGSGTNIYPRWIYFGAGANDGVTQGTTAANFNSASFNLSFRGQTNTQVMTMFAHARKGEINYSNNPTYLKYGQDELRLTSSMVYEENPNRLIANVASSSYSDYSASFKREVYVSKVAIYDENNNLIGVTTLANPVRKEEDQDLTFKLRLDI